MYVVCLDCGKEFAYDWNRMRIVAQNRRNEKPQKGFVADSGRRHSIPA
jgi:hypothetical protein